MAPIDRIVTHGTFELDGGSWEVDNNIWIVGDDVFWRRNSVPLEDPALLGLELLLRQGPGIP